ncbi:MAG: Sapep family Mn(2+)-dependent dipeptidase, partial [Clostridiales Family XIII bacterium]|nr:Sapep family Mn(2+)-dependent dipeptidase [Clostridiales Family XIII bacterium]
MKNIQEISLSAHRLIDERRDEIVAMLRDLIRFASVKGDARDGAPFGEEVQRVYEYMMNKAQDDEFDTVDVDHYGGHIEWPGAELDDTGEMVAAAAETLGIPVHLDVVPAADGWSRDPFGAEIVDGVMYGRGTTDNKGAVAATYAAMKALKDAGFVPAKNVRLMIGLDEETGWSGMEKYLEKIPAPDFGFSPDADFPIINGEKGILDFSIAKKLTTTREKGIIIRSVEGGVAPNSVPDKARAIIMDETGDAKKGPYASVKEKLDEWREKTGHKINGKGVGKAFEITAHGRAAHGARPADGLNAVSVLLAFLGELGVANDSVGEFIDFYNEHIGFDLTGTKLGIACCDEPSGALTLNVGLISMDAEAVIIDVNVRYPVTMTDEEVYAALLPVIDAKNLGLVKKDNKAPIYFPEDAPLITKLMDVYRRHT